MADEIYRPVSDEDMESETPPASAELPIRSLEQAAAGGTDQSELTVEEGAAQRRRQPDRESPEDAHARPLVHIKTKGDGPLSLNQAVDDLTYSRGWKLGDDLHAAGFTERQIKEMGHDALERGVRMDPLAPTPPEAKVQEHFGEDKKVLTPTEAANELTSWRERYAAAQQEELAELVGEAEQERAEAQLAQQPTEQPQQQQPEPQRQPPTPEQIERAQVTAERQWTEYVKQMSGFEAAARNDLHQLVQAVVQEFPSLQHGLPTPEQVEDLKQRDPARFQKLALADKMLRERQQKVAAIAHQREIQEREQAQINAQARAAARSAQDKHFEQLAAQHIPNWERVHGEVRRQARKTLQNAGLSENDIQRLWTGDESIDAHSSVLQLVLAKAAQWDLAQQKARQVRQSNVPQVIKPGTYRRASDSDAQSVGELTARLKNATGREAIRLGTALTKARRAMNGG